MNGTTSLRVTAVVAAIAMTTVLLTACGGSSEPEELTFDLEINDMEWNLDADEIKVKQGDTVTMNVASDLDGYFHVHGYDLIADVTVGTPGALEFTADATGRFSIMYHVAGPSGDHGGGHEGMEPDGEEKPMEGMEHGMEEDEMVGDEMAMAEMEEDEVSEFLLGYLEVRPR